MQVQQRTKRWTEEENNIIKEKYLEMSDEEIGKLIDRTARAVRDERDKLGLHRPRKLQKILNNKEIKPRKTPTKLTFDEVKQMFEERGYILLSDESEYINQGSNLRYICPKHADKGEQIITAYHLKEGKGCHYCGRERTTEAHKSKVSEEEDKALCESKGFEYIKTQKDEDGNYYIYFICNKHRILGVQKMRRGNMNRAEVHGCQYCCGKNLPQWYVEYEIEKNYPNYEVISEYKGMNQPLTCHCKKHDITFTH